MSTSQLTLQSEVPISVHKNNFTSFRQFNKAKVGSNERQYHSNTAVKLGQYVRQREFSKEKQIYGQIKSPQLIGYDDPATRQITFKRDNINTLYDKIIVQISKKKNNLKNKDFEQLNKQQIFIQEILKMIVDLKPSDFYGKYSLSSQISTISTAPNIQSKIINNAYFDKSQRYISQIQLDAKKYTNTQRILDQIRSKDNKASDMISNYNKRFENRLGSAQKVINKPYPVTKQKEMQLKISQSIPNLHAARSSYAPKK